MVTGVLAGRTMPVVATCRPPVGYFGVGIFNCKRAPNMGGVWRTAASLDAAFTFQIGGRFEKEATDTVKAHRLLPHFVYETGDAWHAAIPYDCVPVAVELAGDAMPLERFDHPNRAVYLLGAEDVGIPEALRQRCAVTVQLPGRFCLNVATAASIVMYDRVAKAGVR